MPSTLCGVPTLRDALSSAPAKRPDESGRGRQECPRHGAHAQSEFCVGTQLDADCSRAARVASSSQRLLSAWLACPLGETGANGGQSPRQTGDSHQLPANGGQSPITQFPANKARNWGIGDCPPFPPVFVPRFPVSPFPRFPFPVSPFASPVWRGHSARCGLLARRARGQFVAAIVVGMVGVPLGPRPPCLVTGHLFVEGLPQILVEDRLLGGGQPALAFPAVDPRGDAVFDVLRIGDHLHLALFAERLQPLNRRREFHAVIGSVLLRIPNLFLQIVEAQDGGPTAWPGIAEAGAVGDDLNFLHGARTGSL